MKWVCIVHILLKFISNVSVCVCLDFDGGLFFTYVPSKIFSACCMTLPFTFYSVVVYTILSSYEVLETCSVAYNFIRSCEI